MKEIAKEYQIDWDTTETEMELLKPAEEPIVCSLSLSFSLSLTHSSYPHTHQRFKMQGSVSLIKSMYSLLIRKDQKLLLVLAAYL